MDVLTKSATFRLRTLTLGTRVLPAGSPEKSRARLAVGGREVRHAGLLPLHARVHVLLRVGLRVLHEARALHVRVHVVPRGRVSVALPVFLRATLVAMCQNAVRTRTCPLPKPNIRNTPQTAL